MKSRPMSAFILVAALADPLAAVATPFYEYDYVGNLYGLGDNLSGHMAMQIISSTPPSASVISLTDISSFSITDGKIKITQADYNPNSSGVDLRLTGNAITGWNIIVWNKAGVMALSTNNYNNPLTVMMDGTWDYTPSAETAAQVLNTPGSWQVTWQATGVANQLIVFGPAPTLSVGGIGTVSAIGGASGNPILFSSMNTAVCATSGINGSTVTGMSVGSCTIAANQAGNPNYNAASQVTQTFSIGMDGQTILFGMAPTVNVGGTAMVSATGGASGNPVKFSVDASTVAGVCSVNGSTVTGLSVGTCIIDANQAGNSTYSAAPTVTQSFTIGMGNQTIIFGVAPPVVVGGTGTVSATGGASGNPVTFSSTTTSVCTTSGTNGSTVKGVTVGTCTIAANQAGNANYNAAPQTTQSFGVTPGFALTVINANVKFGTVTSNMGGIVCGTTCSANYASGSNVTLTAIPVSGYQFTGWGGACTGYGNSCTIKMNAVQTVTANFAVFKIHSSAWKRVIQSIIQGGG